MVEMQQMERNALGSARFSLGRLSEYWKSEDLFAGNLTP